MNKVADEQKQGIIKDLLKSDKTGKIIFFVGIAGILLIFLSTFLSSSGSNKTKKTSDSSNSAEIYVSQMEDKIRDMVCNITGSKNVSVIVTLESSAEYVYANEINQNTDVIDDTQSGEKRKLQQKDNTEQKYIIINSADGGEVALLVTELSPKVKGVVIVSDRANNAEISEKITEAVTTALDISAKRVCVTGLYRQQN